MALVKTAIQNQPYYGLSELWQLGILNLKAWRLRKEKSAEVLFVDGTRELLSNVPHLNPREHAGIEYKGDWGYD